MANNSIILLISMLFYGSTLIWAIFCIRNKKQQSNNYYLFLGFSLFAMLLHSFVSIQLLNDAISQRYVGFVGVLYLVFWLVFALILLFSVFVKAYVPLALGLTCVILSMIFYLSLSSPVEYISFVKSIGTNWHIIVAILASASISLNAICAFFVSKISKTIKQSNLPASEMIVNVSLCSMQKILLIISWLSWALIGVTLFAGYYLSDSILIQQLSHKLTFTLMSWLLLNLFLLSNYLHWWSKKINNYLIYISAIFIFIGYFGTRIAIEFML